MCSTARCVSMGTRGASGGCHSRDGISAAGAAGSAWLCVALHSVRAAQGQSLSHFPAELGRLLPVNKAVNARKFMPLYHCALTSASSLGASARSSRSSIICATLSMSAQSMLCRPVHAGAKVLAHAVAARRHELFGKGRKNARRASKSTVCTERISDVMPEE